MDAANVLASLLERTLSPYHFGAFGKHLMVIRSTPGPFQAVQPPKLFERSGSASCRTVRWRLGYISCIVRLQRIRSTSFIPAREAIQQRSPRLSLRRGSNALQDRAVSPLRHDTTAMPEADAGVAAKRCPFEACRRNRAPPGQKADETAQLGRDSGVIEMRDVGETVPQAEMAKLPSSADERNDGGCALRRAS